MSNYSNIKATIDANIKANNNQAITGVVLNSVLNEMIDSLGAGYLFKGIASTSTNPGSPDEKVFYIAGTTGTFTYFNNLSASENELTIFYFDTAWHKSSAQISTEHPVNVEEAVNTDLNICDESGNILVRFRNGHIQTKYFDSSALSEDRLKKFKGKKIAVIGDSISTYQGYLPSNVAGYSGATYAYYYPRGDVQDVSLTWWVKAAAALGIPMTDINNCAWSGSYVTTTGSVNSDSTTSAKPGCSTKRITDLAIRGWNPDIVLIFISCNDWGEEVALGTWEVTDPIPAEGAITTMRAAYALMLNKIQVTYPKARIFCCTILDDFARDSGAGWPSENGNGISTYQWNENIKEIAGAFGCDVIDLHNCGINYSNIASLYAVDSGLHPNAAGMQRMANKVVAELLAKY